MSATTERYYHRFLPCKQPTQRRARRMVPPRLRGWGPDKVQVYPVAFGEVLWVERPEDWDSAVRKMKRNYGRAVSLPHETFGYLIVRFDQFHPPCCYDGDRSDLEERERNRRDSLADFEALRARLESAVAAVVKASSDG